MCYVLCLTFLEGIAYTEIEAEGIERRRNIEIGLDRSRGVRRAFFGIFESLVRGMDTHTEIQANDQSVDIQT